MPLPRLGAVIAGCLVLSACQPNALSQETSALTLDDHNVKQRQNAMRRFDTKDETAVLAASSAVLQDLGFAIEEANAGSGLVVGSKMRDAVEAGQVTGQIFLVALAAAAGVKTEPVWDTTQKIRIAVVTHRSADSAAVVVRVNFQRIVWNTKNQMSRIETIDDPTINQQFFDKLSQAVFLEAHQI
jgi:hypothetical protein